MLWDDPLLPQSWAGSRAWSRPPTRRQLNAVMLLPQSPTAETDAPAATGSWLWQVAQRPGVVETLVALLLVTLLALVWWRLSGLVRRARSRAAIRDYLLGVEQAQSGDLPGAEKRLTRVLAEDPENHYARLLLAKVLAERGEAAAAHKHHVFLQRAFGVDSPRNDLWLAKSLLLIGHHAEAADAAGRAARLRPGDAEVHEFLFRASLAAGDHLAAARAGQRTLQLLPTGPRAQHFGAEVAGVLARAGVEQVAIGELSMAEQCLRKAQALDAEAEDVALLSVRLLAAHQGEGPVLRALLDEPTVAANPQLPVLAQSVIAPAVGGPRALARLMSPQRWRCEACGKPLPTPVPECPRCSARGRVVVTEPLLFAALISPTQALDAIEQNRSFVQRTVQLALDGATKEERNAAAATLLELREKAVEALLGEAWSRGDEAAAAIELLRAMGPAITATLFAAAQNLEGKRLLPLGRSPAALVGRIVQGFDREALPHVEELFSHAPPEYRKVLIDYFLGLADLDKFQLVLEWFPPLEILQRLNKSDEAVLVRFLQAVPAGHFVAEALLLEAAFYREDAVLRALPGAVDAAGLEAVLLRRGPTRTLTKELLKALGDAALQAAAMRLLGRFGLDVLDHVLAAFADEDCADVVRSRLGQLLSAMGPGAVERLCGAFGPEPTSFDEVLQGVLASMGEAAVPALAAAYSRSSMLERFTIGLLPRHNNRRVQILKALAAIDAPSSLDALRDLREHEKDPNLKLRLQHLLHQRRGEPGGASEQAG